MELNIIAPNIAGGGDTMREVRAAAGNLGDLIISSGKTDCCRIWSMPGCFIIWKMP